MPARTTLYQPSAAESLVTSIHFDMLTSTSVSHSSWVSLTPNSSYQWVVTKGDHHRMELLVVLSELRGRIHLSPERLGMRRGGPVLPGREQDGRGPGLPAAI